MNIIISSASIYNDRYLGKREKSLEIIETYFVLLTSEMFEHFLEPSKAQLTQCFYNSN